MERATRTLGLIATLALLTACPTLEQLTSQNDAGPDAEQDAGTTDAATSGEVPDAGQETAPDNEAPAPDAGVPAVDASEPMDEPDSAISQHRNASYDFEGTWHVVSTPDETKPSTGFGSCSAAGEQLPVLDELWTVIRQTDETFTVNRKGANREAQPIVKATLKADNTYRLVDNSATVPVAGAIHWTITLEGGSDDIVTFGGPGWVWIPDLNCGGFYSIHGEVGSFEDVKQDLGANP